MGDSFAPRGESQGRAGDESVQTTPPRLNDDEWDELEAWLDQIEAGRFQRTLGIFHALAVAPSLVPPSSWLPLVLSGQNLDSQDEANKRISLVLRAAAVVRYFVSIDRTFAPDETFDADDCSAFAEGFVLGADLDDAWRSDPAARELADVFLPLARAAKPEDFGVDAAELEARKIALRERMPAIVIAAAREFAAKRTASAPPQRRAPVRAVRVGRNEPCPCGSGKKWKKCCGARAE